MDTSLLTTKFNIPNPSSGPASITIPPCSAGSMAMTTSLRGSPLQRHCKVVKIYNGGNRMVQIRASDSAAKRVVPSYANYAVPIENQTTSSFITRPLAEILRDMNKRVPDKVLKVRMDEGVPLKYIPWYHANRMLSFYAPGWSGEVRNITFSSDGKTVSVVYRVTIRGLDGEAWRESSGTATLDDVHFGDPVQKAEGMAFRRACARFEKWAYNHELRSKIGKERQWLCTSVPRHWTQQMMF
ncbi:hypothetical protein R1flu_025984 [Riccia fluitans]|uniref:Uncharacterized protein n=1 Tax=Riccia fluitans TaxID=41844 RepID=A0ABD1XHN4_9MARC